MDFIFTPILWLLPLSAIPLILHLINNRKFKFIEFGAMKFISSLKNESIKKINLINILLLILRILIIFFIILTISRPTIKSSNNSMLKDSSTNLVVLIDDTYSNYNKYIYEKQRTKILKILDRIVNKYNPNILVEISSLTKDLLYKGTIVDLDIKNLNISETYLNGNITDLMNTYFNSEGSDYLNLDMYVLSDMGEESFKNIDFNKKWNVSFIDIEETQPSPLIKLMKLDDVAVLPSKPFSVTMQIYNDNKEFYGDVNAYLNLDGMELFKRITINKRGEYSVVFNSLISSQGSYNATGRIETENQAVLDRSFLKIDVLPSLKIGLCDLHSNNINKYLNASIEAISEENIITIETCNYTYQELMLYDIIIIDNFQYLNQDIANRYLLNGGHLIVFPEFYKDNIDSDIAITEGQYIIRKDDILNRDIYYHIFDQMKDQNLFNINKAFILPLNNTSIIEFSRTGSIWNRDFSKGGVLDIFGFNFDLRTNNLPLKGASLPFVIYLISNANKMGYNNIFLGDSKTIPMHQQKNKLKIVGDNGYFEQKNSNSDIIFSNIENPGFYSIISDKDTLSVFSANIDTSEIISSKISNRILKEKFNQNCSIFNNIDELINRLDTLKKGYEIWHIILSIAVILLIIESTIINVFEQKT